MKRLLFASILAPGLLVAAAAPAGPLDPAAPGVIAVGPPRAHGAVDRVDLARSGRTAAALPVSPVELARRSVGVGAQAPVVLRDGTIVVALATPEIVRFASDGAELSRVRIGSTPAVRPPVVLSGGGLAVLTSAPSVVFLRPTGKVVATVALPRTSFPIVSSGSAPDGSAFLVPTLDGGVALAVGRAFVELEPSGQIRASATLPERERFAADLVRAPGEWLAVTQSGAVFALRAPAEPRRVGSFGATTVGTPALADGRTLLAQVGASRIVALDLKTGTAVTRIAEPSLFSFDGPFVLDKAGGAWLTTSEGLLLGFGPEGEEAARTSVDRAAAPPPPPPGLRAPAPPPAAHRAVLLADADGRVAFARAGGKIGVRSADGRVMIAPERGCSTPQSLASGGAGRLVLACREGTVVLYGNAQDAAAPAPAPPAPASKP